MATVISVIGPVSAEYWLLAHGVTGQHFIESLFSVEQASQCTQAAASFQNFSYQIDPHWT
jgi:hypothetical protein